ncbi:MAG: class I SAM-dependent methyltransferase [Acidobacteria bacterium]|nr:class I SAM-dependent methyltransferase [Acidobacteriota bacterium]
MAPAFHFIDRRLLPEYEKLLDTLSLDPAWTALDMATGTGTLAAALAARGHHVAGFDFVGRLLRRAQRRVPGGRFELMDLADVHRIPYGSYDLVTMGYLLHGLSPEMRRFTLCHAARIARHAVLVFDYARPGPWIVRLVEWAEGPHYASFIDRPFREITVGAGLTIVQSGPTSDVGGYWLLRPSRAGG